VPGSLLWFGYWVDDGGRLPGDQNTRTCCQPKVARTISRYRPRSGIRRWGHERSECTPVALHPFVMHWKGWNLAMRTALLAGAFLTALALTLTFTLAPYSAFTFTTASTILRPFRLSWGAFSISLRHPNHLLSPKCIAAWRW